VELIVADPGLFQATKRHLSSRIDRLDCSVDEFAQITAATKDTVCSILGGGQKHNH